MATVSGHGEEAGAMEASMLCHVRAARVLSFAVGWVLVKGFKVSYHHNKKTILFTIDPSYGYLN